MDRGERGARPAGHGDVVVAHDREVLGHAQAVASGGLEHAESLEVRAREDRGGRLGQAEELVGAVGAALGVEVAEPDQVRVRSDPGRAEGRAVAVEAGERAHHVLGPRDDADAAVAELDQVPGRHEAALPVRRADRGDVGLGVARGVDDRERDGAGPELLFDRGREGREDEHDAERAAREHALDPLGPRSVPGAGLGQHDARAVLPRDVLDAADELHGPDALELVEHDLDEGGRGGGALAAPVAVLDQEGLDPVARPGRDVGPPVEHLGHGREGHLGLGGHGGERDPPRKNFVGHAGQRSASGESFEGRAAVSRC
ncbi:hypothetical protein D3C74_319880 [compost metagenome]